MKKIVFFGFALCLVVCGVSAAIAAEKIEDVLKSQFPKLKFDSVSPSPLKGLYEVRSGLRIAYFSPEQGILVLGQMVDKTGKNLTTTRIAEIMAKTAKELPLDKAIKTGSGKHSVIEFTDPDCPFCRKASVFFDERSDVTRYTFLVPLPTHPDAENKTRHILCAKDRGLTLAEVMKGKIDGQKYETCKSDQVEELIGLHKAMGAKMGVTATPFFVVDGVPMSGADIPKLERLLAKN